MNFKKILPVFSYLFHPLFATTTAALYFFFISDSYYSNPTKFVALFQIIVITVLVPILLFFMLKYTGKVDSMMVANVSQRKIPLLIQCFLTIFLLQKSITILRFPELYLFILGGLVSTFVAFILLFFKTKASLHMLTISSLTAFVIGLSIHNQMQNILEFAFMVVMNGFVASSRLVMKAHTIRELVIGFFVGLLPQVFLLFYIL